MIRYSFLNYFNEYNDVKNEHCPLIIFLMGPTASGKTSLIIALKKQKLKIKIISVDSALVYKDMNIGTAKPSFDELKIAPHKLIDIRDPADCYSVSNFYYDAIFEIENIIKSGYVPILVGGTMLYFKVLLTGLFSLPSANKDIRDSLVDEAQRIGWDGLYHKLKCIDPVASSLIHFNDHKRIIRALEVFLSSGTTLTTLKKSYPRQKLKYKILQFAVTLSSKEVLNNRIKQRFYKMLELGFENEVSKLFSRSDLHVNNLQLKSSISCVGYRQMWEYLSGKIKYDNMIYNGIHATKRLAKQQLTWLRNWSNVHWLNNDNISTALDHFLTILSKNISIS